MKNPDLTIAFMKKARFDETTAPCTAATYPFIEIMEEFLETRAKLEKGSKGPLNREELLVVIDAVVSTRLRSRLPRDLLLDLMSLGTETAWFDGPITERPTSRPWSVRDRIFSLLYDVYRTLLLKLVDAAAEPGPQPSSP